MLHKCYIDGQSIETPSYLMTKYSNKNKSIKRIRPGKRYIPELKNGESYELPTYFKNDQTFINPMTFKNPHIVNPKPYKQTHIKQKYYRYRQHQPNKKAKKVKIVAKKISYGRKFGEFTDFIEKQDTLHSTQPFFINKHCFTFNTKYTLRDPSVMQYLTRKGLTERNFWKRSKSTANTRRIKVNNIQRREQSQTQTNFYKNDNESNLSHLQVSDSQFVPGRSFQARTISDFRSKKQNFMEPVPFNKFSKTQEFQMTGLTARTDLDYLKQSYSNIKDQYKTQITNNPFEREKYYQLNVLKNIQNKDSEMATLKLFPRLADTWNTEIVPANQNFNYHKKPSQAELNNVQNRILKGLIKKQLTAKKQSNYLRKGYNYINNQINPKLQHEVIKQNKEINMVESISGMKKIIYNKFDIEQLKQRDDHMKMKRLRDNKTISYQ